MGTKKKARVVLELRTIYSSQVELPSWQPRTLMEVYFPLELEIGEKGNEGRDIFQVLVATPEGLRQHAREAVISRRATLVLAEYSWPLLDRTVREILSVCSAETWNESVLRLQRYFSWEYEDYELAR